MGSNTQHFYLKALKDAIAGSVGSVVTTILFFPIDVAKTRVQSEIRKDAVLERNSKERSIFRSRTFSALCYLLKEHGFWRLFRGVDTKILGSVSSGFIYFYAYTFLQSVVRRQKYGKMAVPMKLITAGLAGAVNVIINLPSENLCMYIQLRDTSIVEKDDNCSKLKDKANQDENKKNDFQFRVPRNRVNQTLDALRVLTKEDGLQRFWRGLVPSLLLTLNPAINYTVYDILKAAYLKRIMKGNRQLNIHPDKFLGPVSSFLLAAIAKSIATIATYPLIRAKVVMMANPRSDKKGLLALIQCLLSIIHYEGYRGLYASCGAQLAYAMLKSALLLAIREQTSRLSSKRVAAA